jgi:hypothetical protein
LPATGAVSAASSAVPCADAATPCKVTSISTPPAGAAAARGALTRLTCASFTSSAPAAGLATTITGAERSPANCATTSTEPTWRAA